MALVEFLPVDQMFRVNGWVGAALLIWHQLISQDFTLILNPVGCK
jgi:hypothetical protein